MPEIVIPYSARDAFVRFHRRTEREAVMICHRRAGKTVCLVVELILRALANTRSQPPPLYAFFYPTWKRAKDIAWPYLKYFTKCLPTRIVREGDLSIDLWPDGPKITLYGAANSRAVGLYLDGVVYDETDEIPSDVFRDVSPALSDYGGWSVWAGMLKGRYGLWKRYTECHGKPGIFAMILRASESGIIPQTELDRMKQPTNMGEAAYEMQMECNPNSAIANAIYGVQMDQMRKDNRIGKLAIDPASPLYAFGDIGHSLTGDDWSWWFLQIQGRDFMAFRYYARTGEIPAHYATKILEIGDELGLRVGGVFIPHDGARKDRHGRTAKNDLEDAGLRGRVHIVDRTPHIWDSINEVRATLPRVWIDQEGCGQPWMLGEIENPSGIDCMDFYTKKIEATSGLIKEEPNHNQYSHGADAFRTFIEAARKGLIDGLTSYEEPRRNSISTIANRTKPEGWESGQRRIPRFANR